MPTRISAPSKTFLLGEYAVLEDLPGLILATEPRFTLTIGEKISPTPFHPESPAGRLLATQPLTTPYSFDDPHAGAGGLGASSAEFLLSWSTQHISGDELSPNSSSKTVGGRDSRHRAPGMASCVFLKKNLDTILELENAFKRHTPHQATTPPSGYDIIGQLCGDITYYCRQTNTLDTLNWPFENLAYVVIRTGHKLATHEHLKQLHKPNNINQLAEIVNTGHQAIKAANAEAFCTAINDYAEALSAAQLVAPHTQRLLTALKTLPYIRAAKGCGAMGADTVLAILNPQDMLEFRAFLATENLNIVAAGQQTSPGIHIDETDHTS
ncbi:MAG: hypothetical protein DHS20C10_08750 [marine bacterium B5-7]|nr:MAG: hypothetical protein DHS20C10_08750 [marine bacterium B5-7]